ncbi:ribonuclease III [Desulfotalea psychrophila]|uniref:Ribonuclease 3 n=1 Tax=Desulfotalea psychrophila (strain LSv54 / DSM 12343) TaxID=177439 RepID=RNC_DESPS|nr:ribonuclease III [Desulfotalea psychrophila]Q6ANV0.1 RecName: Full=Ribonuclease 3; AltName: Full=Ribonuclease III; Short=RNase III [Desulfotalea psychrophila LSv54]CAG35974.1 related to ribonuclease III [Desulfotalea psychrophila LSv54]
MGIDVKELIRRNRQKHAEFEKKINYKFIDLRLLQKALIHSSYAFEQAQAGKNNERLEFVGDAVLDLVVGNALYRRFPEMREGELTRLRAALVNEGHLATMARKINLGYFLCLGKGEDNSKGREKSSILSCAYEAVIGAIFQDGGYDAVAALVERFFLPVIDRRKEDLLLADAKSRLQEILQEKHNEGPSYRLDNEEGPSHKKRFTISVLFRDEVLGTGEAGSKKEAEQRGAALAIKKIESM